MSYDREVKNSVGSRAWHLATHNPLTGETHLSHVEASDGVHTTRSAADLDKHLSEVHGPAKHSDEVVATFGEAWDPQPDSGEHGKVLKKYGYIKDSTHHQTDGSKLHVWSSSGSGKRRVAQVTIEANGREVTGHRTDHSPGNSSWTHLHTPEHLNGYLSTIHGSPAKHSDGVDAAKFIQSPKNAWVNKDHHSVLSKHGYVATSPGGGKRDGVTRYQKYGEKGYDPKSVAWHWHKTGETELMHPDHQGDSSKSKKIRSAYDLDQHLTKVHPIKHSSSAVADVAKFSHIPSHLPSSGHFDGLTVRQHNLEADYHHSQAHEYIDHATNSSSHPALQKKYQARADYHLAMKAAHMEGAHRQTCHALANEASSAADKGHYRGAAEGSTKLAVAHMKTAAAAAKSHGQRLMHRVLHPALGNAKE
jgi:hypothetical protein